MPGSSRSLVTAAPPDADSIGNMDALGHENVGTKPAAIANLDRRAHESPVNALRVKDVIMVEHTGVGSEHGMPTHAYGIGGDNATVGIEVAAPGELHARSGQYLKTAEIVDINAAPEHHDTIGRDIEPRRAAKIYRLAAAGQEKPRPEPNLRARDAGRARAPF